MAVDDTVHSEEVQKQEDVLKMSLKLLASEVESAKETVTKVKSIKETIESYKSEFSSEDVDTIPILVEMIDDEGKLRIELRREIEKLGTETRDLESVSSHFGNGLTRPTSEQELYGRISKLEEKVDVLETENKHLKNTNASLIVELDKLAEVKANLGQANSSLTMEINDLKQVKADLEQTNSKLTVDIRYVKLGNKKLEEENSKLTGDIKQVNLVKANLEQENSSLKLELDDLKQVKVNLEEANSRLNQVLENEKYLMESKENIWKEKVDNLIQSSKQVQNELEEKWKKEKDDLIISSTQAQNVLGKEVEMLVMSQTKLIEELDEVGNTLNIISSTKQMVPATENQITGSPLQRMIEKLPDTMRKITAPKGTITGEELGSFMGSFVNLTAYMVTRANKDVETTALSGLATLLGLVIGTMFNNIVTYVSTVEKAEFKTAAIRAVTSIPYIILGALIPILVGGFAYPWVKRALITTFVALFVKIGFATFWSFHYRIPTSHVVYVVCLGVVGRFSSRCSGSTDVDREEEEEEEECRALKKRRLLKAALSYPIPKSFCWFIRLLNRLNQDLSFFLF